MEQRQPLSSVLQRTLQVDRSGAVGHGKLPHPAIRKRYGTGTASPGLTQQGDAMRTVLPRRFHVIAAQAAECVHRDG